MSTDQILALLIAEREKLNRTIEALGGTSGKRRGRPPGRPMPGSQRGAASIDQYPGSPQATAERRWPESNCRRRSEAVGGDQGWQGAVTVCKKKEAEGRLT
jgi:hypothetical protein